MATPQTRKLRVLVDANVLIAGHGWPRFPYEVLQHAVAGDFTLVLYPYVIAEARRNISRLFPEVLANFETFLLASEPEIVADPSPEDVAAHQQLIRSGKDIPVGRAAILAHVDCLVSTDKDFTDPDEPIHQHLTIRLPGTFLREYMGWTSEALEAIRQRNWKDLEE